MNDWRDGNGGDYYELLDDVFRLDDEDDDDNGHEAISINSGGR
jgi:hypothetical protein